MNPKNLVDLVTTHNCLPLNELRIAFPEAKDLLRSGMDLGDAPTPRTTEILVEPKIHLAGLGVRTLRERVDAILAELAGRLNRAAMYKTIGSVISAISSAGLIASLLKGLEADSIAKEVGLAVLACSSSLFSIFAEKAAGGANGGQIREYFEKTVSLSSRILQADLERQRMTVVNVSNENADKLLANLDDFALQLHDIELKLRVA